MPISQGTENHPGVSLRLRDDLRIMLFKDAEGDAYVIEDPLRNTYYKIGLREYRFLCFLEKGGALTSLPTANSGDDDLVTQGEAKTILQWLAAKQLLKNVGPEVLQTLEEQQQQVRAKNWYGRFNLITFKLPLFNPDPLLNRVMPWLGFLAGPLFLGTWLILALVALAKLISNWHGFIAQSSVSFSPQSLLYVGIIWVVLKLLHELGHAITCRRYNGRVYEAGVLFILFIPLTYVNATSSWGFANRWQRIHVSVAGILMELFIAWVAIIYWSNAPDSVSGLIAHHTVLVAGVSSLLFNANPLMRFDGYYLLSDLVGLPNLYFLGIDTTRRSFKKWWLGITETGGDSYGVWVYLYGLLLHCWRVLVLVSLSILAAMMFAGWGVLLVAVAVIGWVVMPLSTLIKRIPLYRQQNPNLLVHFSLRFSFFLVVSWLLLFGLHWQKEIVAPAVVVYEQQFSIRNAAAGFIDEVLVQEGDKVKEGQALFRLSNIELQKTFRENELRVKMLDLRGRKADAEGSHGQLQIIERQKKALLEEQRTIQEDLKALRVTAPGDGMVVGRHLSRLEGVWMTRGTEICQLVSPENTFLMGAIEQNDISSFPVTKGDSITIDMAESGYGVFSGTIERVEPTASKKLAHFSLAAPFGGSLDVQPAGGGTNHYELLAPRIAVYVTPPEPVRSRLSGGQQAYLRGGGVNESLGNIVLDRIRSWVTNKQESARLSNRR